METKDELDISKQNNKIIVEEVSKYLELKTSDVESITSSDIIKELCVKKLCEIVGIKCRYNYKTEFFNFFSSFVGEAVSLILKLGVRVAPDSLRLFKYNKINFVQRAVELLESEDKDEAIIDLFNLADDNKYLINEIF